jgi:hypothetical protein
MTPIESQKEKNQMRFTFYIATVLAAILLSIGSAWAMQVEYLAGNATISPISNFAEPGRPGGTTSLGGRSILEWRDSAPGKPTNCWIDNGTYWCWDVSNPDYCGDGVVLVTPGSFSWTQMGTSLERQ